jgi:SsrA-binding protein
MSLVVNKKASFNYEIQEKFAAGIELFGFEVKSLRNKQGSLEGAYVTVRGNEAFLIGMNLPPYQMNNTPKDYDPSRNRRLLLTKKEILELKRAEDAAGLTIIPLSLYNKDGLIKIDLGIAKGKKKFDKRETLKKKDTQREIERELKAR